jgi:Glycosyl transferase family 2
LLAGKGLSVIIPVTERFDDVAALFEAYKNALARTDADLQFVYVLDGGFADLAEQLRKIDAHPHSLEIIVLTKTFGESAALTLGFDAAKYDLIMTLPAYQQVSADSIPELLPHIADADIVVARRWPRHDSRLNRISTSLFHGLLKMFTRVSFSDLGCGVRLLRKRVVDEVIIYGDQYRFLPILADRRGFRVVEADLPQADSEANFRVYAPGVYVSRLLDLLGVFFIVRFTKKPLRFFGMVGSVLAGFGSAILLVVVLQRYFSEMSLADRPVLLLGSLLLVLGAQLFALGLIGELIIFTHARELKEYTVAETINMDIEDQVALHDAESSESAAAEASKS